MEELSMLKQKLESILANYPRLFLFLMNELQLQYDVSIFSKCLAMFFTQKKLHQVWWYCFNESIKRTVFPTNALSKQSVSFNVLVNILKNLNMEDMDYSTVYGKIELSDLQDLPHSLKSMIDFEAEVKEPSTLGTFMVMINRICNSLRFSRPLSLIFRKWTKTLQTKFTLEMTYKIISNFVSDFLLIPPLLTPHLWGLVRAIPLKTSDILLFKRVLLHLSDRVPFSDSKYLEYNCLINAFRVPFETLIIDLCSLKPQVCVSLDSNATKNSKESHSTTSTEFSAKDSKTYQSTLSTKAEPKICNIGSSIILDYELRLSFEYIMYYLLEIRPLIYQYCISLKNIPLSRSQFFWNLLKVLEKIDAVLSPNFETVYRNLNIRLLVNCYGDSNDIMSSFLPPELIHNANKEKGSKPAMVGRISSDPSLSRYLHHSLSKSVSRSQLQMFFKPPASSGQSNFCSVNGRKCSLNDLDVNTSTFYHPANNLSQSRHMSAGFTESEDLQSLSSMTSSSDIAHTKRILSMIENFEYKFVSTTDEKIWKLNKQLKQISPSDMKSTIILLRKQHALYRKKVEDLTALNMYLLNRLSSLNPQTQKINYFTEKLTSSIQYRIQKNKYTNRLAAYMKGAYRYSIDDNMLGLKNLCYEDRIMLIWSSISRRVNKHQ